eukprot:1993422-Karenia_brevis.AAC.1
MSSAKKASSSIEARRQFFTEHDTPDEDEDGVRRVKRGEAEGGIGGCLMISSLGNRRLFHGGSRDFATFCQADVRAAAG